ncbi:M20/M25/M40 family metallo-hydrolase [Marivirga atlantica]|jgi:acetylornithine deacetylase/succinyl-diaminopimelate desuccinylase-like protein|uniref:M20/M25/M40 family metallo-hydrolase n=1 Tax=Marivirga atlantica TaxID=1548457 RepID=A0A937DKD5_9BACT|nr:M20/M25/M40 family metallo-hydrolase [Marivirga atlantica]MBL0765904.1 M20/M25/M40 family metallo-hydrolase [Marivirga atlantica]
MYKGFLTLFVIIGVLLAPIELLSFSSVESDSTKNWPKEVSYDETVSLLSNYIQKSSVSGSEKEAGLFISNYITDSTSLNLRVFSDDEDRYNLAASLYPLSSGKPNIILQNHIDVVPAEALEAWKYGPFSGYFDGEYIYGRGALDCKGLGIMQLKAVELFKEQYPNEEFPFNVTVLFLSGEEMGGKTGAHYMMQNHKEELNAVAVLGEGGAGYRNVLKSNPDKVIFGVSVAEKQSLWVKLKVMNNNAGHGAAPGKNYANLQLISSLNNLTNRKVLLFFNRSTRQMFKKLGKAEGGIRGFFIRNINWSILAPFVRKQIEREPFLSSLLTNTITVTNIQNPPGPPNQISNYATATLDCRLVPGTSVKSFLRYIERKLDNNNIEISVISQSPEAKPSKTNKIYDAIEESISREFPESETIPFLFPATSDNSVFRSYDIPAYGLIPAVVDESDINSIHSDNERISTKVLGNGIKVYYGFMQSLLVEKEEGFFKNILNWDSKKE